MLDRLSLRLRIGLFFALMALGTAAAAGLGVWAALGRGLTGPAAAVQAGVIGALLSAGLIVGIWFLFDANVARAIDRLAHAIRARTHAGITRDLDAEAREARYLGDLAPAVAAISAALVQTRDELAGSVARETGRLAAEKTRLETLLADVPVAVLLCTADHQLVFYNGPAVEILGGGVAPGLDRSLLDYLRPGPIRHAYDRLAGAGDPDAASDLMAATQAGGRLLAGRMRVLRRPEGGGAPGYVLTLRDVTADLAAHASREALLAEVFDRVRRPAANLQTVIGVLDEAPGGADLPDLSRALMAEVQDLTRAITDLGARHDALQTDWRPLALSRSADLADALAARLAERGHDLRTEGPDLILTVDGFEIVALLAALAGRVADAGLARGFVLNLIEEDGPGALIRLEWDGPPLAVGRLDGWLAQPLGAATGDLTARAVLMAHGTECWPEAGADGRQGICLPIRQARRAGRRPAPIRRQVVYDFDLLSKDRGAAVAQTRLSDLTLVVFDTETTGLSPARDEMVQIAALRIVNGRRVEGEVFDTLVDPGRPIPAASTDVHGVTDQMVKGAPTAPEAARAFHAFARGAVLVAHNAPFDLEFLRRTATQTGLAFDHPVLDTVLMSAVVYGQTEVHTLDALCARLGVVIPETARHTALGDTIATAEAFLRLVPILRARGIETFDQVLTEMRRHGRLLKDANLA